MMLRRFLLTSLVLLTACSGKEGTPGPEALADASICDATPPVVLAQGPYATPFGILWHDGMIYGSGFHGSIFAVPDTGGTPTRVVEESFTPEDMRIDGDRIVYAMNGQMYAAALHGGSAQGGAVPQLLVDVGTPSGTLSSQASAMDGDALYVARQGTSGTLLVREKAGDAAPQVLAQIPPVDTGYLAKIGFVGDDAIVAFNSGVAYAVAKEGGPARALPKTDGIMLIGFDDEGPVWDEAAVDHMALTHASVREAGGFWPSMPRALDAMSLAPAADGWLVGGSEKFSDDRARASVWLLDATKNRATRIACRKATSVQTALAVTSSPDAVFYLTAYDGPEPSSQAWQLVRVDR